MCRQAWDTSYHVSGGEPFTCARARPHLAIAAAAQPRGLARHADRPGHGEPSLLQHVKQCVVATSKTPNLVAVDFAAVDDLLKTDVTFNGVLPAPASSLVPAAPSR
jgi:hypothetical protein